MKTVYTAQDLVQFGLNPLTGESCAYGMRLLFDMSEAGCKLIADYFGMPYDPNLPRWQEFRSNWNTRVGDEIAVASIMLPRDIIKHLTVFAMFHVADCDFVLEMPNGSVVGLRADDEYCNKYMALTADPARGITVRRNFARPYRGAAPIGGRNQHAATGRIE